MTVESVTHISDLNASYPAAGDDKREGDDHIRNIKTALKTDFPNVSGAVTPTHTELNYVDGVTSAIQTQLDAKAPLASPALTGTPTAPTAAAGTGTTQIATCAFVAATSLVSALPGQTGNAGKTIATDGTNASWSADLKATVMRFVDGTDATKKLAFGLSGITTATTRTVTLPDKDGTLAMTNDGATQSQMEAASATTVFATPANVNWHPGVAKAWLQCDAAGTVDVSHNVTSITDDGTGIVTVTIATDFSAANYVALASAEISAQGYVANVSSKAAGSAVFKCWDQTNNLVDPTKWNIAFLGDQA